MQKIIDLPQDFSILLERTHYEYFTMKENVTFLIEQHKDDVDFYETPLFKKYHDKQVSKKMEYENLKNTVTEKYLPVEFKGSFKHNWRIDFENSKLIIESI